MILVFVLVGNMNQKLSISLFCTGLTTFITSLYELLSKHNSWSEMSTPGEVGHIMLITGSFIVAILGALGTQMPRDKNSRITDKVDIKKVEPSSLGDSTE